MTIFDPASGIVPECLSLYIIRVASPIILSKMKLFLNFLCRENNTNKVYNPINIGLTLNRRRLPTTPQSRLPNFLNSHLIVLYLISKMFVTIYYAFCVGNSNILLPLHNIAPTTNRNIFPH